MVANELSDKVIDILMKYNKSELTADQVKPETTLLGDLQINSARLVDIIIDFEDTFNITVDDEEADGVTTVKEAVDMVSTKVAEMA